MKTILLNFADRPTSEPSRYKVAWETATAMGVCAKWSWGYEAPQELTRRDDGTLVNQHGCAFVIVRPDRRPKPYTVLADGIDGSWSKKFATLAELQAWIRARWQGTDYLNGAASWHDDYVRYELHGATLADLGQRNGPAGSDAYWDWTWKAL